MFRYVLHTFYKNSFYVYIFVDICIWNKIKQYLNPFMILLCQLQWTRVTLHFNIYERINTTYGEKSLYLSVLNK